jgi:hypothetical protein
MRLDPDLLFLFKIYLRCLLVYQMLRRGFFALTPRLQFIPPTHERTPMVLAKVLAGMTIVLASARQHPDPPRPAPHHPRLRPLCQPGAGGPSAKAECPGIKKAHLGKVGNGAAIRNFRIAQNEACHSVIRISRITPADCEQAGVGHFQTQPTR